MVNLFNILIVVMVTCLNALVKIHQTVHLKYVLYVNYLPIQLTFLKKLAAEHHFSLYIGQSKHGTLFCKDKGSQTWGQHISFYDLFYILDSGVYPNFLLQLALFQLGAAFYIFLILNVEPGDVMSTAESKLCLVVF